jgi:uncharacterized protein (TIGR00369 family)
VSSTAWPTAERFPALSAEVLARWSRYIRPDRTFFPTFMGLQVEELRAGYTRLRLPLRPEVCQGTGVVHGGALSTLIDTVAVPSIGTYYERQADMLTISMTVNFVGVVDGEDAIGEGWVEQAGRSVAFVRAEVRGESGALAATGSLVFRVKLRDSPA